MKNREYKALLAAALVVTMIAGGMKGTALVVHAEERKANCEAEVNAGAKARKEETVYVKINGDGKTKQVTVSDQLKNITDFEKIEDISGLQDIENVKGKETFSREKGKLVWNGEKKEICYQGTSSAKLPAGVKITYILDGKEISADELEGKNGHLKIHYEYQNNTSEDGRFIPFAMVTGLVFDTEKFANITIDNGKLISDGEREIALGMGLPNIKEELGITEIDIPDSFTVEADVTDCEAVQGITVATNDIFNQIETDKLDDLDDLKDAMGELEDASAQMLDGSGTLSDGLEALLKASGSLKDGIGALESGSAELAAGSGTLLAGAEELHNGNAALADGTTQLLAGAKTLSGGIVQVEDGAKNALGGSGALLDGVKNLNNGIVKMQQEAGDGVKSFGTGVEALGAGINQAADGAESLKVGIDNAEAGAAGLAEGLAAASDGAGQLAGGAAEIAQNLKVIMGQNDNSDMIAVLEYIKATGEDETVKEQLAKVIGTLKQQQSTINGALSKAAAGSENLSQQASGLAGQLGTEGQIGTGANALKQGLVQLRSGAAELSDSLNTKMKGGVSSLQGGVNKMAGTLDNGTKQLAEGSSALLAGNEDLHTGLGSLAAGAASLSTGSDALYNNLQMADDGAVKAANGARQLTAGAKDLKQGAGSLHTGIGTLNDGAGELIDGVQTLANGAKELHDGMVKFDEEGIKKLVNAFDGDISALLNKLNQMLDASKEYRNFSGISKEMDGSVKFVFVTEK